LSLYKIFKLVISESLNDLDHSSVIAHKSTRKFRRHTETSRKNNVFWGVTTQLLVTAASEKFKPKSFFLSNSLMAWNSTIKMNKWDGRNSNPDSQYNNANVHQFKSKSYDSIIFILYYMRVSGVISYFIKLAFILYNGSFEQLFILRQYQLILWVFSSHPEYIYFC
jgi:hypothetical protein